ncbi:MAG: cytochrome c3 family protein [Thermodesulfovibrionales bacterium]|nr:cytochrome c3 family protein [Thermodesulfovibrionales bacterium]
MKGLSVKGWIIIAVLAAVVAAAGGVIAFKFYDYTQNNPKFCLSCHLMQPAFDAWTANEHKELNCHECHHLSIPEQNRLLISFVFKHPETVPERHGKVIVPWQYCIKCHWEKDERYPAAPPINRSRIHAKHYFMEQIECSNCHGYITHKFVPEERFCIKCHEGKEVHGAGMEGLACLNCHTDRTADLRPGRKKCLFCHGGEEVRKELIEDGTIDVRRYQPAAETIKKAIKINAPEDAPMQFNCYECHKPHDVIRPDWASCLRCHGNIPDAGKHGMHVKAMGMQCRECHRPHIWRVTKKSARKDCVKCHEYREPRTFLGG